MAEVFDAYHKWLGIRPEEQPPNHYRLLGIGLFEEDADVIDNAAVQRMVHVRTFQLGRHQETSQRILNEIAAAKTCLLQPGKKAEYDAGLRQQLAAAQGAPEAPEPPGLPVPPILASTSGSPIGPTGTLWQGRTRHGWRLPLMLALTGVVGLGMVMVLLTREPDRQKPGSVTRTAAAAPKPARSEPSPVTKPTKAVAAEKTPPSAPPAPKASEEVAVLPQPENPVPAVSEPPPPVVSPPPPVQAVAPPVSEPPERKAADLRTVPSDALQQKALDAVKEVYGEEYKRATTSEERVALATKLLEKAAESRNDPGAHFVLLRLARDVAVQGGDANTVFRAVEEIAAAYDVDADAMRVETLLKTARVATSSAQQTAVVAHAISLLDEALEADDYQTARALVEAALAAARRGNDKSEIRSIAARKQQIDEAAQAYEQVKPAMDRLEKTPADPEANLAVGKYLCLNKGDWDKGLPMLAVGSDAALKDVALQDLVNPTEADAQVQVGDGWWELAEKDDGLAKQQLSARAEHWYQKALPALSGLAKVKVTKRLEPEDSPSMKTSRSKSAGRGSRSAARMIVLFDGKTLKGWHPREPGKPSAWTIDNGQLIGLSRIKGSDLVSDETFQDFELHLEFFLGRGAQSGVFLRGLYEIQLYDDTSRPTALENSCGALWGQLGPTKRAFLGPGTWNSLDVRLVGRELTVTLNGQTVIDRAQVRGPTSKEALPVAEEQPGPIFLQRPMGQNEIHLRNIRVRRIE